MRAPVKKWIIDKLLYTICHDAVLFGLIYHCSNSIHIISEITLTWELIILIALLFYFPIRASMTAGGAIAYDSDTPRNNLTRNLILALLLEVAYLSVIILSPTLRSPVIWVSPAKLILIAYITLMSSLEQKRKIIMLITGKYSIHTGKVGAFFKENIPRLNRKEFPLDFPVVIVMLNNGNRVPLSCNFFTALRSNRYADADEVYLVIYKFKNGYRLGEIFI